VLHEGMQYDPIQGQGQGHEPFKVGNPAIFKSYLHRQIPNFLASLQRPTCPCSSAIYNGSWPLTTDT